MKDILNDMTEVEAITPQTSEHATRLQTLKELQRITLKDIVTLRNDYIGIDKKFETEIAKNRKKCGKRFQVCNCLKV